MGSRHGLHRDLFGDDFLGEHGHTRSPLLVQWMATEACDLRCPHCLCGDERAGDDLSLRETETLLEQVASMGVEEFLVTGGEPLLREDLPQVIDRMEKLGIRWSLNTSASPSAPVRRAVERHPPAFVAVSVDGPERVHDAFRGREGSFRECMEAISFFGEVTGGRVAAGTTLGSMNVGCVEETLGAVVASGASSWGLHLVFPEGRARTRPDLFLTTRQVRGLMSFVARAKGLFPVTLADEIGYTGEWEPELRSSPFFCGAGRVQCVVLAGGEVVPCTTADRSASAGSIRQSSLEEIWHGGFAGIRGGRLPRECERCDFRPLCGGGCWLQRRGGMHCTKEAWISPVSRRVAAGMAVCLGLASVLHSAPAPEAGTKAKKAPAKEAAKPAKSGALEDAVLGWYLSSRGRSDWLEDVAVDKKLSADPAGAYLVNIQKGKYPKNLGKRAKRIRAALETQYRSLAFASLLWRDLMLWCLEGKDPSERTDTERKLLRETLGALEKKAGKWRKEIFEEKLDAFVASAPNERHHWFMMSKAFLPHEQFTSAKADLSMEHWGLEKYTDEVTVEHLEQHPFGESMRITMEKGHIDVFDVLAVPGSGESSIRVTSGGKEFEAHLPAGADLLYGDVLRLLHEQNGQAMDEIAAGASSGWDLPEPAAIYLPALERRIAGLGSGEADEKAAVTVIALSIWIF